MKISSSDSENKIEIRINGRPILTEPGTSLLQAALLSGIEIPHLCWDPHLESHGDCGMCVVELEGNPELIRACSTLVREGMEIQTETEKIRDTRKKILEEMLVRHGGDCRPPCMMACPARTDCQGYVTLLGKGEPETALELIMKSIPLPASIGRVCPHPCEDACRRGQKDEPISILWLKRYAADHYFKEGNLLDLPFLDKLRPGKEKDLGGKRISIIGGGPMGLSAAFFLRQKGYPVTVYEAMPQAGGMLRYGIPQYRLPNEIIDEEIRLMETLGVDLRTGIKVGTDISFETIRKESSAVLLAVGAWVSTGIGCPGEDLPGVVGGIQFLEQVARKEPVSVGQRVAIIGGGNTAMDACRTAVRLGATKVYNIYRRGREEMPADQIEIEEALEEGVIFKNLRNPAEILPGSDGHAALIRLQVMELGEPDASGRRSPVPVEGTFEELPVDRVILAVGQAVEPLNFIAVDKTRKGGIQADPCTMMTSEAGIFAGGDCGNDKISIAIEAIADAKRAAASIDHYLRGEAYACTEPTLVRFNSLDAHTFEERETLCRARMDHLDPHVRKDNFEEVVAGFTREDAEGEGKRCLECGCHDYFECQLIHYAHEHDVDRATLGGPDKVLPKDERHDFIRRDPNKCIECGKCVRVCQERLQIGAQGDMPEEGANAGPSYEEALDDRGCVACGMCVAVCPSGAMEGIGKYPAAYWETEKVRTTCTYCGVGCQLNLILKWGKVVGVEPAEGTANQGMLCVKGRFAYDFINHRSRLKTPLIRKNGILEPASWEEALDLVASTIRKIREEEGPDAIMGFSSAKVTNENNYLFQKMMRAAIGTNNVDHCARLCHSSTVSGLANTLGSGAMTNPIGDVFLADLIFITGSNTTESHPVMGAFIRQAVAKGTRLIVADPKRIPIAEDADLYLQIKPGTSVALTNGMLHVIFRDGLEDREYMEKHTIGGEELRKTVEKYTPEYTAEICGLEPADIELAAHMYAEADAAYIAYAMGITQHLNGTHNVVSMSNLALATGNLGKPGSGVNPLRGQNNVQGACDMGALPGDYPGYQKVANPEARAKFEKAWGRTLPDQPGLTVTTVPDAILAGQVKMLYVMGENPVVADPDTNHIKKALEKAFVVVQDIFENETAEYADVVLPSACFAETDGTFTNTERRVQRVRKAAPGKGEAREDWQILMEVMNRIGYPVSYESPEDIFEELRRVTPSYAGMTWDRIDEDGLCWPCPSEDHPGTPILHKQGPIIGEGRLMAVEHDPSPETQLAEYPIVLMTGRVLEHYHTRTMTKLTDQIQKRYPENFLEINLVDADELGIADGDRVSVTSRRGTTTAVAVLSTGLRVGTAFMPFHFAEGANLLTDGDALDPTSKIPGFKQTGVKIQRICD